MQGQSHQSVIPPGRSRHDGIQVERIVTDHVRQPSTRNASCRTHASSQAVLDPSTSSAMPPVAAPMKLNSSRGGDPKGTRFSQLIRSYSEPFSIQASTIRSYSTLLGSLCCGYGPITLRRWAENGKELFYPSPRWTSFGLTLIVRSPIPCLPAVTLQVFVQRKARELEAASVRWSICFPKIVPKDSTIMRLARVGDVEGIKAMFIAGCAGCRDTTSHGTSLLHVCFREIMTSRLLLTRHRLPQRKVSRCW